MRQKFPLQHLCAAFDRAWYVELEPESTPFATFAMKLETSNEPRFLEVEEAKRFSLLIAIVAFRPNDAKRSGRAELRLHGCAVRGALGLSVLFDYVDIGAGQAHDATLRGVLLKQ